MRAVRSENSMLTLLTAHGKTSHCYQTYTKESEDWSVTLRFISYFLVGVGHMASVGLRCHL